MANCVKEIGQELDRKIFSLKNNSEGIIDCFPEVIETHNYLVKSLEPITGQKDRSFASKYLHFHCPDKFFLYDERVKSVVSKIVRKASTNEIEMGETADCDEEYADFACRMIILQDYINEQLGRNVSPRNLDDFLLAFYDGKI